MDYMDMPGITVADITLANLEKHFPVFYAKYREEHPDHVLATGEHGGGKRPISPPSMDPDMADLLEED